jgi:hypothetical protein
MVISIIYDDLVMSTLYGENLQTFIYISFYLNVALCRL